MTDKNIIVRDFNKKGILNTRENTRGYFIFLEDPKNIYSVSHITTSRNALSIFEEPSKIEERLDEIVASILISDAELKGIPYHHISNSKQKDQDFVEAIEAKRITNNYFDNFCLISQNDLEFFTPKRNGGSNLYQKLDYSSNSLIPKEIREQIRKKENDIRDQMIENVTEKYGPN